MSSLPAHPAADTYASQHGLGALVTAHLHRVNRLFLLVWPVAAALLGALGGLFSDDLTWWGGALIGALIALVCAVAVVIGQTMARGRRLQVRYYQRGLVAIDGPKVIGGRWRELRLNRTEMPQYTYHWSITTPDGEITVSDNAWSDIDDVVRAALEARAAELDEARRVLASGGAWDFSGWRVTRHWVSTPTVQGSWAELRPRVSTAITLSGSIPRVYLQSSTGETVAAMDVHDNDLFADIVEPYVPVLGRPSSR